MTATIASTCLVELLTDALQTADTDPDSAGMATAAVHIATHRAAHGDEPGLTDLLAATSTDRFVIGHSWICVDGQIIPSAWPVDSVKTVITICKQLIVTRGKEHTVDVEVVEVVPDGEPSGDEKAEHPGYVVTLRETPALFDTDTEFTFHADHESKFPLATVRKVLDGDADPTPNYEDGPETQWTARVLAPLTAVAKRRKAPMRFFRSPDRRPQVVQIGPFWLGAAIPATALAGEGLTEPSIDPLLPVAAAVSES